MIDACKDFLPAKRFGTVAFVCVISHFLCGLVFTAVTAALRVSENGKFSCSVDAKSTATFKKQVDQACLARYDQAYNSPIPLYGFVLLGIDFIVLVSVIYSVLVWKRVDEIESRHERQIDGEAVNRGQNRKTVYVFYSYFAQLVFRGLFVTALTVLQHTCFYPNGFDFKFNCNLLPTDQVTSNINTSKNTSRNLNGTLVTCENGTASEKWISCICVSVINSIVAAVILAEVIYLLPRLPILKRRFGVGWSCDSEFVIEYLLGKEYIVPDESEPLTSIENNPPHCSKQVYNNGSDSVAEAYSTSNNSNQDTTNENNPNSIVQECPTIANDMQDFGSEDCIDLYKKQVLSRSLDPSIIYGPNANIDDLYVDVVIHTERAQYNFPEKMKERHEIYDVYMKVPPHSICLERIHDLFYPNKDTEGEFPPSILVIGRPGIGKTVLTEKILRDWANGIDEYYSDKIVLFFKFRWFNENFNKLTNFDLKTFLRLGTGLSEKEFESIYVEIAKNPQKAILIFDGLDEYHGDPISCLDKSRSIPNDPKTGMSAMYLFIKLVLGDLLKGATVVVTSRPTAADFYSRLHFKREVEIIGFTLNKIKEYVMRFCDNNNTSDLATKIWNHIEGSSELLNLCYIPVICFIVCVTFSGCLSNPRSETSAFPATLTELYQRALDYVEKYHRRNANRNLGEHELDELQRLAYFGMEDGQLVFNQTLFADEMKTSGLLNSLSNPIFPLQTQFCFVHLTIQEFLAARHVTGTFGPPEIKTFISEHVESGKWHLVLQFIAGLLGKKMKNFDRKYKDCVFAFAENLKITSAKILLNYHEVFIMKCLRETENEDITKEVCQIPVIKDSVELRTTGYSLSQNEWGAVTSVCKHMKNLSIFTMVVKATTLSETLGFLQEKCVNKLDMTADPISGVCEISEVFSSLMALNCICKHTHTELTSLKLLNFRMTVTGLSIIRNFFEKGYASQLEHLSLKLSKFCSNELCEVLNNGHCPNLTHLCLEDGSMIGEGAELLFDGLTKALHKVISLNIGNNKSTRRCISTLVKALQDERCQLTYLSLRNNAIGDEGVGMLFEDALTNQHCKLTTLDLEVCWLTRECIPSLCMALQDERCQLTDLSLRWNVIGDRGAGVLIEDALTNEHCKLTKLNLDKCSLTIQCIPSLCKALQDERCQLTNLSLQDNAIGDKGAVMLLEDALTNKHCKLTKLNLDDCSLTDQCIPSLCKVLKGDQCEVTALRFYSNDFTVNGKKLLRDTMNYESCKDRGLKVDVW